MKNLSKLFVVIAVMFLFVALPVRSFAFIHHLHQVPYTFSKGTTVFSISPAVFFSPIIAAAVWHIPAWTKAKANHTEAAYQAQKMWPQIQVARFGASIDAHATAWENSLGLGR